MFKLYNHSSEQMFEIGSGTIDLIITSPPYNIGTEYGSYKDNIPFKKYKNLLKNVIKECSRVLKRNGK